MTYEEAKARAAAIEAEETEAAEMQYRYGYMVDKMHSAKLFREKVAIKKMFPDLLPNLYWIKPNKE